jgi:UDP-N-acetylglucosamine:LPS N-acetylglucosamine transferase
MAKVELFYFDAGGGHRAAMTALSAVLSNVHPTWRIEPVNLQQLMLPVDPLFRTARIKSENVYNTALKRGWTRSSRPLLRALQTGISLNAPLMERELVKHWRGGLPDMVVSLIPNFNGVMFRALQSLDATIPYVTIMTDIADTPPAFWQEDQDQYLICGSDKAFRQAHLTGFYCRERLFQTSGMILAPSFYDPAPEPPLTRDMLGLDGSRPTALIMFGGNGSAVARDIHERLMASGHGLQTIVMCGRNEVLRRALAKAPHCHAVGFTDHVADYMRLADFFIGKPGPGSVSEALQMGLPVLVENNARTLVQERYNPVWVEERGAGLALQSFDDLGKALDYLLNDGVLERYQTRVKTMSNTAVFEIAELLPKILTNHRSELPVSTTPTSRGKRNRNVAA